MRAPLWIPLVGLLAGCPSNPASPDAQTDGALSPDAGMNTDAGAGTDNGTDSGRDSGTDNGTDSGRDSGRDTDGGAVTPLTFTSLGPRYTNGRSGQISAIAFHPTDPNTMLIAGGVVGPPTASGVYRTTDHGASWTSVMTGLVATDGLTAGTVNALWINPSHPTEVFAGTAFDGIFRSVDGGTTWTPVDTTSGVRCFAYVGGTLYAGTSVGILVWNPPGAADGGGAWSVALATPAPVQTFAVEGSTALAGTLHGDAAGGASDVYTLSAGHWTHLAVAPAGLLALAINPANPRIVYAAIHHGTVPNTSRNNNLYVSLDGGATWPTLVAWPMGPGIGLLGPQAIAFSTTTPGRLYVAGDSKTVWTIGDGNPNPTYTIAALDNRNPGVYTDTRALYVFPNGTADRCVDASDQGIAVADNCAVARSPVQYLGNGLSTSLVTDFSVSPDGQSLVATLQDFNAVSSTNAGATWTELDAGETGHVAINPAAPTQCYAFSGAFYQSMNGCGTFTRTTSFAEADDTTSNVFAFDPNNAATFYVLSDATPSGASTTRVIQKTTTHGTAFAPVPPSWNFSNPTAVAIAPQNAMHILVADQTALSVSLDGGMTWRASTGLPPSNPAHKLTVAFSPAHENTVLAALYQPSSVTSYLSTDGGLTFTSPNTVVPSTAWRSDGDAGGGVNFGGVVYNRSTTAPIAVITSLNGAYLSRDDGTHWQRIDTTTTTRRFTAAHFADGHLYLGTFGQGVLRSNTPLE